MNNYIFLFDAIFSWSGYLYQGDIAVYLAMKKIEQLVNEKREEDIDRYHLQVEQFEDVAVWYESSEGLAIYESIHQVKDKKDESINAYKGAVQQLMLEKGYIEKNVNRGQKVAAYLHTSQKIANESSEVKTCLEKWMDEINNYYKKVSEFKQKLDNASLGKDNVENLLNDIQNNLKCPMKFNRKNLDAHADNAMEAKKNNIYKSIDEKKDEIDALIDFLENTIFINEVNSDILLYEYDNKEQYCNGKDVFDKIKNMVWKYKGTGFSEEQIKYIVLRMYECMHTYVLDRHLKQQKNQKDQKDIPLSDFKKILDSATDDYEKEANILSLKRQYLSYIREYCEECKEKSKISDCPQSECKLQNPNARKELDNYDTFVRFCYNLNPESDKKITDRDCLFKLLDENGCKDSVFMSLKEIKDEYFIKDDDASRLKVKNKNQTAFITAINGAKGDRVVANIKKAMAVNKEFIEAIFEANQLVTANLNKDKSIWGNNANKISPSQINQPDINGQSIYIPNTPEFISAENFIKDLE